MGHKRLCSPSRIGCGDPRHSATCQAAASATAVICELPTSSIPVPVYGHLKSPLHAPQNVERTGIRMIVTRVGTRGRSYRVRVRGAVPSDLKGRVSAAHASAIQGSPKANERAASGP